MKGVRRVVSVLAVGALVGALLAAQETVDQYQGPAPEQFLAKARVTTVKGIGVGVTLPQKATLVLNGVTHLAVFKTIDESKPGFTPMANGRPELNFQDTWQTEIPAYIVDRIIGLGMVPATVERAINGQNGSLQWWVESMMPEADRQKNKVVPPNQEAFDRLILKMRLFDQLICNTDRHLNNILITKEFELRLIDHSRSFRPEKDLRDPKLLTRFSQSLLDGLQKLEYKDLRKQVGKYLLDSQVKTLLERRDAILALAKTLVAQRGEAAVIYP